MGRGNFDGGNRQTIVKYRHVAVICAKTTEPIEVPFRLWTRKGRKHHVLHGRSRSPWEEAILVERGAHCKVYALPVVSCAKTAEPIHLPFRLWTRVDRRMHKFNRIRYAAPMCPYGRTRCRNLSNNIEPSVYGNALCQTT